MEIKISIHAPREGCDSTVSRGSAVSSAFQSTHPVRGATGTDAEDDDSLRISIHAPREGCDFAG